MTRGRLRRVDLKAHIVTCGRSLRDHRALVGDIDRGGVFAQIVGTMVLLEPQERALVTGHVINKFRGDPSLLTSGLHLLEEHTGTPAIGVLPYFFDIHVPEEDSLGLQDVSPDDIQQPLDVAVMRLPHIANFDDFDPLRHERGVRLRYVRNASEFGEPDLVLIPGSKTTVDDLEWLRTQGLADLIVGAREAGTPVIGICAGFQMLDKSFGIHDDESSSRDLRLSCCHVNHVWGEKVTHQSQPACRRTRIARRGSDARLTATKFTWSAVGTRNDQPICN